LKRDEHIEAYSTWNWEDWKALIAGNGTNIEKAPTHAVYKVNI
jgi:hypothetical protein